MGFILDLGDPKSHSLRRFMGLMSQNMDTL